MENLKAGDYMVFFDKESDNRVSFLVAPVVEAISNNEPNEILYHKKEEEGFVAEFNEVTCRVLFTGTMCWRGLWEGRLYFKDDEYWSEELSDMCNLYCLHIEPRLKMAIVETCSNARLDE